MWTIRTGRAATITASGNLVGVERFKSPPHVGIFPDPTIFAWAWFEIAGMGCQIQIGQPSRGTLAPTDLTNGGCSVIATNGISTAFGNNYTFPSFPYNWTNSYNGTWSISADVEECFEFRSGDVYTPGPGPGSDFYDIFGNGIQIIDPYQPPAFCTLVAYLRLKVGGNIACSVNAGGAVASVSDVITTATRLSPQNSITRNVFATSQNMNNTASCSLSFLDDTGAFSVSASDTGSSVSATQVLVQVDTFPPNPGEGSNGRVLTSTGQTKSYDLAGVIRRLTDAYPNTLGLKIDRDKFDLNHHIDAAAGAFTDTHSQRSYSVSGIQLTGVDYTGGAADEYQPIRLSVRPGAMGDGDTHSLLAYGEDVRDTRMMFRCFAPWAFTSVQQGAGIMVDDGSALTQAGEPFKGTWANQSNATVSSNGTEIVAAIAGGTGEIRRSFTTGKDLYFSGYRYLDITVRADANGRPFSFKTLYFSHTKNWTADYLGNPLVANIAPQTYRIDLCGPANMTAVSDPTDSHWPRHYAYGDKYTPNDGPYWGVSVPGYIVFSGLANGGTYYIDTIQQKRRTFSRLSLLSEFDWIVSSVPISGDPDPHYGFFRRLVKGSTDGRVSTECFDARTDATSDAVFPPMSGFLQYGLWAITNSLAGAYGFDGWPGWSAAGAMDPSSFVNPDVSDGSLLSAWQNFLRPATWAQGDGMMWQSGSWVYSESIDCTAVQSLYAQMVVDVVDFYGGAGDLFQVDGIGGSFGGAVKLRAAYMLRGGSDGLVLDTSSLPVNAATVTITDNADSSDVGSTITDVQGYYKSITPFGKGEHSIHTVTGAKHYDRKWTNAKRKRLVLRTGVNLINPWNLQDNTGAYHNTAIMGNNVFYWRSDFTVPNFPSTPWAVDSVQVTDTGKESEPRMARDWRGRLYLVYTHTDGGTSIYERYSDDEGETWSDSYVAIAGGTHPTIHADHQGTVYVAAYVGGNLKGNIQFAGDTTPSIDYTFTDNVGAPLAVADDTFHLQLAYDGPSRLLLVCNISGEGVPSNWVCNDDQFTFTRLA